MSKRIREESQQYSEPEVTVDTTPAVDAIGKMELPGNIVPHAWYKTLRLPSGKPDIVAIILLSDVVYWYKPTYHLNEETNQVDAITKKFAKDKLQKNYSQWSEAFGFSKDQIKEATDRLVERGLIVREFRNIHYGKGIVASNVMFIEPVPEAIEKASTIPPKKHPISPPQDPPIDGGKSGPTYTDITTNNIVPSKNDGTEPPTQEALMPDLPPEERVPFDELDREDRPTKKKVVPKGAPKPKAPSTTYNLARAIAGVCMVNFTEGTQGRYLKAAKNLLRLDPTAAPEKVQEMYGVHVGSWYYEQHWKGKLRQAPNTGIILETWNRWGAPVERQVAKWEDIQANLKANREAEG